MRTSFLLLIAALAGLILAACAPLGLEAACQPDALSVCVDWLEGFTAHADLSPLALDLGPFALGLGLLGMAFFHGVDVTEEPSPIFGVRRTDSALPFIVGCAPGGTAGHDELTLANNLSEFAAQHGAIPDDRDYGDFTLVKAAEAIFQYYGRGPLLCVNVCDPSTHTTDVTDEAQTFGADDTLLLDHPFVSSVVVTDTGGGTTYTEDTDYTVDADKGEIMRLDSGSIPAEADVEVDYTWLDPSQVAAADVVGGVDGSTGVRTGIELAQEAYPNLGRIPTLFLAPGHSDEATVAAALTTRAEGTGGFTGAALIDLDPAQTTPADAITAKSTLGVTSPHAFVVWPSVTLGSETYPASVHACGVIMQTDEARGDLPYESPSNKAARVDGYGGSIPALTLAQANQLNAQGITTFLRREGWRLWGNRTSAYPANTDPKDTFLATRRMLSHIERVITLTTWQKVDSPTNPRLINTVVQVVNQYLNGLQAQGALLGGTIGFYEADNPRTDLVNGIIKFRVQVTPPVPAEEIEYIFRYDPDNLGTLFG